MKDLSKGFTLIELLVVIAIIGILSSIVLASLNTARGKGSDATVKGNLNTIRSQAELYYTDNNSYAQTAFAQTTCPGYNVAGTNMFAADKNINGAIAQATTQGGNGNSCSSSGSAYAVAV